MAIFHGNAIPSASSDWDIPYSCRFNDNDSSKLTRTAWTSSAANRRKWTYSVWFKLSSFDDARDFFFCGTHDECMMSNSPANTIDWFTENTTGRYITTQLFRDPSAWYHAVFRMDTTDGTPADRMQLFINGTRIPDANFGTSADPTLNHQTKLGDGSSDFVIGSSTSSNYWDGYFAEIHFVDGSALNADSFGETNDYGGWSAIEYSGSHGTNGFYLPFSDAGQRQIPQGDGTEIGDMTSGGNLTAAFDGTISAGGAGAASLSGAGSHYVGKDWGSGVTKTLTGVKTWGVNDSGYESEGSQTFSLHVYGSDSTPSNATDGTKVVEIVNNLSQANNDQDQTVLSGFTTSTAYRYHWVAVVDRTSSGSAFMVEIEFYEGTPNGLGVDAAGSNDFASTNIAASDQMLDSPTNNFCTLNALNDYGTTLAEGNLEGELPSNSYATGTMAIPPTGKWYYEMYIEDIGSHSERDIGIATIERPHALVWASTEHRIYLGDGTKAGSTAGAGASSYGATWTTGDIIGVAVDMDTPSLTFYKNNATQGVSHTDLAGKTWIPIVQNFSSGTGTLQMNFGQSDDFAGTKAGGAGADDGNYGSFFYAPPDDHLALCSKNLPDCAVIPSEHFGIMLTDEGAGARTFASHGVPAGAAFSPDFIWFKSRGGAENHRLVDRLRGVQQQMRSNQSLAEATEATGLTSFDADGFTVGADGGYCDETGVGMVIWNWKANGTGASNELGTINTTATSANTAAGFSIITYPGTGNVNDTVGHGLNVKPNFVIAKQRAGAVNGWLVGSVQSIASMDFTDNLVLDTSAAVTDNDSRWYDLAPTDTLISIGTNNEVNMSGGTYVMYCWHSVEGYSRIGSYKGNSNVDGTFVYTGFRPKFILNKAISNSEGWQMMDTARDSYNVASKRVEANTSAAEATASAYYIDFLSNGFKIRNTDGIWNNSSHTYLYIAFAEMPFKNATAR